MRRLCLFGGSFDPVHTGHLHLVAAALGRGGQGEVVVLPAADPPHKRGRLEAPAAARLEMARIAFAHLDRVRVSDREIERGGISYTVETVRAFREGLEEEAELAWLIGSDSLPELPDWREIHRLLALCRILTVPRPGWPLALSPALEAFFDAGEAAALRAGFLPVTPLPVSSTELRRRLAAGEDPGDRIPTAVARYIREQGLYGEGGA